MWYKKNYIYLLFLPISILFYLLVTLRFFLYKASILKSYKSKVPIVVIGNITAGGTGKTPFIIYLTNFLQKKGLKVAIIIRGFGRENNKKIIKVQKDTNIKDCGDEAYLIFQATNSPIFVGQKRTDVIKKIEREEQKINLILSDDGLQHYQMQRDLEFCLFDGVRRSGNGFLQPAGPLREPIWRTKYCDHIVYQQKSNKKNSFYLKKDEIVNIQNKKIKKLDDFKNQKIVVMAAIGHPQRFFAHFKNKDIEAQLITFPDHYDIKIADLKKFGKKNIIMTVKDKVKCENFAMDNLWYMTTVFTANDNLTKLIQEIEWTKNY
jgi:tetraacyldisaccharide 4'-kinase